MKPKKLCILLDKVKRSQVEEQVFLCHHTCFVVPYPQILGGSPVPAAVEVALRASKRRQAACFFPARC